MNTYSAHVSKIGLSLAVIIGLLAFVSIAYAATTNALLPTADGFYTQFTPSTSTVHAVLVDETTCNGLTDYNSTNLVGNRDSYVIASSAVPLGATITQIQIKPCASRVTGGGANPIMNVFYRLNGVNSADAGAYSLTGTTPIERATTTFSGLSILKTATATLEVGAVYTSGTKGVRLSRIATVITYTPAPALPPAAPSNLVATASTSSLAIALTWNDNSTDETEFQILRGLSTSTMSHLASTTAGVTTYNNTGLASSTTYYYQVRSYNASGYSTTSSNFAFATTGAPPSAPSGLTATASTTPNRVFLNWTNTSGTENRWTLQRSTSSPISGFNFLAYLTGFGVTSHTDSTVASSTTYYYRVFSGNAFGTSTQSNVASTTTF